MADGKIHKEVRDNLEIVIDEWIETALTLGREVPNP